MYNMNALGNGRPVAQLDEQGKLRCQQCRWRWVPRLPVTDVRKCPRCQSVRWDTPKVPRKARVRP